MNPEAGDDVEGVNPEAGAGVEGVNRRAGAGAEAADLVVHLARFAGALRERGIGVGLADEAEAARALLVIDLSDPTAVRLALRTTLRIPRPRWELFDALFRELWIGRGRRGEVPDTSIRPATDRTVPRTAFHRWQSLRDTGERGTSPAPEGTLPGYSPEAVLRRRSFEDYAEVDFHAMQRLLERLVRRLAVRRSRRLVPSSARGRPDLRRSFRHLLATRGEPVRLARRARAIEQADVVLLCDTSGSMEPYTRFLLAFILSLRRVTRRCEIFAFNTALTRLTPILTPGKVAASLDRMAAEVPDWSGGTNIGACLGEFIANHRPQVTSRTTVVILSDGLDLGEPNQVSAAMRAIHTAARRVIWLNPLLGDRRYEPKARGMRAALPFVDHFAAAHNIASLERLIPLLAC